MKFLLTAAAALSLAGVAAADSCAQTRSDTVAFGGERSVIVTATSIPGPVAPEGGGDNCRLATVVPTVHTTEGQNVAAYAAAAIAASYDLGHTEEPVPAARLGAFLDEWVKVTVTTSDQAPPITDDFVVTELEAEAYETIRASKAPMLCYPESAFKTACFAPDESGYIVALFTREQT